ncbi:fluoride efflux transporter CrcB [Sphingomonas sp. SUN019]|uniref:fluoride efflux transporter CrcB n=1 Tax=Sphingomonas sp. SUN019 TaxID=2937788 RepID=UPI002164C8A4|nr:fluoride efflux transporter CrcB [Sphingomonas sp. SUN019]UVO51580.1 fluoride efflux transporter CrcB [Sphingomonas sp. SUN019]
MQPLLLVMAGGAVGSAARYLTGRAMGVWLGPDYPWGTLTVNLVGGFLMGLLVGVLARNNAGESWRLLLGVGALGGFTTFSAFALDVVVLFERGAMASAALYAIASVVGAIVALFAGLSLVRAVA